MSKWYTVKVTTVSMMLVEVADESNELLESLSAQQVAMDNTSGNDVEADTDSGPMLNGSEELEHARRHADQVLPL